MGWLGVLLLASLTFARTHDWRSNESIWRSAITWGREKPRPWFNYAAALAERGEFQGARASYEHVLTLARDPRRSPYTRAMSRAGALANLARLDVFEHQPPIHARQLEEEFPQWAEPQP